MSSLLYVVSEDDLKEIMARHTAASGIQFSIMPTDGEPIGTIPKGKGIKLDESIDTIEGPVATVTAYSDSENEERVTAALALLKTALEDRLANESELESLSMEIANNYEELNQVMENNNLFLDAVDQEKIIELTLTRALEVSKASIATIMLYDSEKKSLKLEARSGGRAGANDGDWIPLEGSLWQGVVEDLTPLIIEDVSDTGEVDRTVYASLDFSSYAEKTFLSVPLKVRDEAIGVLNVGDREEGVFDAPSMKFLQALASQCASTIEKERLYKNIEKEARLRSNFQRYLSPSVVDDIVNNKQDLALGGEVIECSVLFADIVAFTTLSESQTPEVIVRLLNEYFSVMTEIIFRHKGTLDKFIGDAIMVIFGAPIFSSDAHLNAVSAALEMHQALNRLRRKWVDDGLPVFEHRIGINTGLVVAGNIGSPDRMDYTVIGDVVNLASRVEHAARPMTTLITQHTHEKVKDLVRAKPLQPIQVKGKTEIIRPYEVLAVKHVMAQEQSLRRFARFHVAITLKVGVQDGSPRCQGTLLNLSLGGALFAITQEVEPGSVLEVSFRPDPNGIELDLSGRVVYRKKLKDNIGSEYYHVGIEFDSSVDRYRTFLKDYIEEN